jgi:hypothetical protein
MKLGNFHVHGASPEQEKMLLARDAFIDRYCAAKGWTKETLTMEQILEIRAQDGWKHPTP